MRSLCQAVNITISDRLFGKYASEEELRQRNFGGVFYSFRLLPDLSLDKNHAFETLETLSKTTLDVRLHCPFFKTIELAHQRDDIASHSCQVLKHGLEIGAHFGLCSQTIHIGLGWENEKYLSWERAKYNLSALVEYGNHLGVTVTLENLPYGYTSDPVKFLELLQSSGASAAVDFGHINASRWGKEHAPEDFFEPIKPYLHEAHIYETERTDPKTGSPFHVAPQSGDILNPMLDCLWKTNCNWWHIELDDQAEVEHTQRLLQKYLRQHTT